jgi:hypothetical protein
MTMTKATNADMSSLAGLGSKNQTEPPAVDVERQPMPDRAPSTTSNVQTPPVVRLGPSPQSGEKMTEADDDGNPTHHTGRIPPPVTGNQE